MYTERKINMDHRLFGLFSGFPNYSFPYNIAERLREEIKYRKSIVFVSAWPDDHKKNDSDAAGMHDMFKEIDLPFTQFHVIDNRMEFTHSNDLICEASCIFLMGGHPGLQIKFLQKTGLDNVICKNYSVLLGVSAGAINMAKNSLDTKESNIPYKGLGLVNITVKPHFDIKNQHILSNLLSISMEMNICAMEDNSAIFILGDKISNIGKIHWISQGKIYPFEQGNPLL